MSSVLQAVQLRRDRDPVLPDPILRVEVWVNPDKTSIPGIDKRVHKGKQVIDVYKRYLPDLEAMVEDRWDLFETASQIHETQLREFVKEKVGPSRYSTRDLPESKEDWDEDESRAANWYGGNPYAEFYKLTKALGKSRGIRPLKYVRVLEELPPIQDERIEQATSIAKAMTTASPTGEMKQQMEFMKEQNDRLMSELNLLKQELQTKVSAKHKAKGK